MYHELRKRGTSRMAIDEHRRDSWPNRLRGALRVLLGHTDIAAGSRRRAAGDRSRTHASAGHADRAADRRLAGAGDRARPRRPGDRVQRSGDRNRAGAAPRRAGFDRLAHAGTGRCDPARRQAARAAAGGILRARAARPLVRGLRDAGAAGDRRRRSLRHSTDDVQRSQPAAPGRGNARRLRRQCQPRAAYAAGRAARLRRDAARPRQGRSRRARKVPRHHAGPGDPHGAADRRSAFAFKDRAQRASAAEHAGRPGADRAPGGRRLADAGARPRASRSRSPRRRNR